MDILHNEQNYPHPVQVFVKKINSVIRPYDVEWPSMFESISCFLKANIKTYVGIEHVGSTSIPGMDAKPIIDIDIEIRSVSDFDIVRKELECIGYEYCGDQGIEGREVFKRSGTKKSLLDDIAHHLYVCSSNSEEYQRHILFRNRLRSDQSLMEEYKAIKHEILKRVGYDNKQAYVEAKQNNYKYFFDKVHKEPTKE